MTPECTRLPPHDPRRCFPSCRPSKSSTKRFATLVLIFPHDVEPPQKALQVLAQQKHALDQDRAREARYRVQLSRLHLQKIPRGQSLAKTIRQISMPTAPAKRIARIADGAEDRLARSLQ